MLDIDCADIFCDKFFNHCVDIFHCKFDNNIKTFTKNMYFPTFYWLAIIRAMKEKNIYTKMQILKDH